eukprot:gene1487-1646_t
MPGSQKEADQCLSQQDDVPPYKQIEESMEREVANENTSALSSENFLLKISALDGRGK